MRRLWAQDDELSFRGRWWQTEGAFVAPKPATRSVVLVSAGSSSAGIEYAAAHSDIIFVTSPAGANASEVYAALPAHTAKVRAAARSHDRAVKIMINPHVICRETENEAWGQYHRILDGRDDIALGNFVSGFTGGDQASWKNHKRENWAIGGNVHLVGTPEQIVDGFTALKEAGCDGVQINFYDFLSELEFFGEEVMPLLREAGLRTVLTD